LDRVVIAVHRCLDNQAMERESIVELSVGSFPYSNTGRARAKARRRSPRGLTRGHAVWGRSLQRGRGRGRRSRSGSRKVFRREPLETQSTEGQTPPTGK
jgi:hypothetical protein